MMNIVLIGFMGSGKSEVAKHLCKLLDYALVEMDDLVCQKTNTSNMHEVFAKGGELLLRETEIAIAKEYAPQNNLVVSTGGGVVHNKIILDYFKKHGGKILFLNALFDKIADRLLGGTSRPLFNNIEDARKMYDLRLPLYLAYSDNTINLNALSAEEIALKIVTVQIPPPSSGASA